MTSFNCEKYNHSLMVYLQLFFLQLCGHTRLCRVIVHFTASSLPDQTSVLPACLTEMKAQTLTDVLRTLAVLTSYIYVYLAFQHMDIHCRATVNQLPLCPGLQAKHLSPSSECPQGWKRKKKKENSTSCRLYASSEQNQQGWHWPKDSAGLQIFYTALLWPALRSVWEQPSGLQRD